MRRQIGWLVAGTTSAVILAFLIPLALLVRTLAEDRALATANQEAQTVAAVVATVADPRQLAELVRLSDQRSQLSTAVVLPSGSVVGSAAAQAATRGAGDDVATARSGQAFTTRTAWGAQVLVPVITTDGTAVVRTAVPLRLLRHGLTASWTSLGGLGAVLLGAALLAASWLGRRVSAPLTALAGVAHRLRGGELDARAEVAGPPEVIELATALNRLADRIGELLVKEREAVADLSHRLRTPVTALRLDVDGLDVDGIGDRETKQRLGEHVDQLQRTVDAIVKDARRPVLSGVGSRCDAALVVRERVAFWSALAVEQQRRLEADLPGAALPVAVDAGDLADVVDVLVDNVFAHTPEGTAFRVHLGADAGLVRLRVDDEGPGSVGAASLERGASSAGSSGLGLDIARRAAEAAGGGLSLHARPGGGTSVTVTFAPPPS